MTDSVDRGSDLETLRRRLRTSRLANVVLGVATILLVVVLFSDGGPGNDASPVADDTPAVSDELPAVRRDPADQAALGPVDAPVVLVEWIDFRCPFCAVFTNEVFPTLVGEYVDSEQIRIEVIPVAFFGDESTDAAVAAHAAGEQGKFFEFMEVVYASAPESGRAELPRERLVELAVEAGVPDAARFAGDLEREDLRRKVSLDTVMAQQVGVSSVPFFVIGESGFAGAQPVDVFRGFIDQAVAGA